MDLSTRKSYVLHTFSSFNICEIRYIYQKVSQYLDRPLLKLYVIGQLAQQDSKTYQDSPSFQQGFIRLPCDHFFFPEHFFLILFLISSKSSLGLCKNLHEIFAHVPKVSAVFGRAPRAAIFISKIFLESKYTKGDALKKAPTNQ